MAPAADTLQWPVDPSQDQSAPTTSSAGTVGPGAARPPRKLNRSANQLHRNQACLPCRRRRIKCDASRPHCSSCVRSFRFLARTQPDAERDAKGIQCVYEDGTENETEEEEPTSMADGEDPRDAVRKLEARIAELQNALAHMSTTPQASTTAVAADVQQNWMGGSGSTMNWQMETTGLEHGADLHPSGSNVPHETTPPVMLHSEQMAGHPGGTPLSDAFLNGPLGLDSSHIGMQSMPVGLSMHAGIPGTTAAPEGILPNAFVESIEEDVAHASGPFLEIFWPGWPPRLPTPSMLDHLVTTFFNVVPSISRIIHRQAFMQHLALPPTHANFPHPALLHAICAVTARYSAAVKMESVEESLRRTNSAIEGQKPRPVNMSADEEAASQTCFGERHAHFAQLEIRVGNSTGRRLFEICQAQTILTVYYQQHAKWMEGWMVTGAASRLAVPLGLMSDTKGNARTRNAILDAPEEDWHREERRLLMAYITIMDFSAAATSGWPNAVALDELMCRLPAARADFDQGGKITENPQTWYSLDLYTFHPVVDNFVLFAKGLHLLGQIIKFRRKCQALDDPFSARATSLFRKLDGDITAYHYSFPPELRDPLRPSDGQRKGVDADLVAAHLIPHVAAIKLHESFADMTNMNDPSSIRILAESRAILSVVYLLTSTTLDFSYVLTPVASFYFFAAARTFVLFYQRALEAKDFALAKLLLSEIDVFRMTFKAMARRFCLGARHGGMIDQMLQSCYDELGIPAEAIRSDGLTLGHMPPPGSDWRRMPHPYNARNANWNLGGSRQVNVDYETRFPREFANDPHHPLHVLFLTSRSTLKDKMDVSRGFHSPAASPQHTPEPGPAGSVSNSTGTSTTVPTPPITINDGGAAWLQYLTPNGDTSSLSSDETFHMGPSMHPHVGLHGQTQGPG